MKQVGALLISLTLALVNLGCNMRPHCLLEPDHVIQAGQVIRNKDLVCECGGSLAFGEYEFFTDQKQVVGHKALTSLHAGRTIRLYEVDAKQSSWAKDLWDVPGPNDPSYVDWNRWNSRSSCRVMLTHLLTKSF